MTATSLPGGASRKTTAPFRFVPGFVVALAVLAGAGVAAAEPTPLRLVPVAEGLSRPLLATSPPRDRDRLFVVEQRGRIEIVRDGEVLPTPFLDLSELVSETGTERGLLGLAFHPDYEHTGWFYVNYTRREDGATLVVRYRVSAENPDRADPTSAAVVLGPVAQPLRNHNGGGLAFGPDGKLYVGMGDGGGAGDRPCRAQNGSLLLGKLLRLEEDGSIPPDNPFVGVPETRDEIWASGLRNPWRFSFDRATGDLYIGDVGQNDVEEVDVQPAGSPGGENYGWRMMEGSTCFGEEPCPAPAPVCGDPGLVLPVHEYTHAEGCSVTGGFVYRGCAVPDLQGTYFFADFCRGTIWSFRYDGASKRDFRDRTAELTPESGPVRFISSFGEDADGEIHLVDRRGAVYRIEADAPPPAVDLGFGKVAGNGEVPELSACGLLGSGKSAVLRVRRAPPGAEATLYVSRSMEPRPFRGGTLVPGPFAYALRLRTDERGELELTLPGGGGPFDLYLQVLFADPGATEDTGFSNALRATWGP